MKIADILSQERTLITSAPKSQKKLLETVSELVDSAIPGTSQQDLFSILLERERLGSTGIGHGVAIPHARVKNLNQAKAAFIKLEEPVDFEAIDKKPIDLVFALFVPEQATDDHLQILATISKAFQDPDFLVALRKSQSKDTLYHNLVDKCDAN